MTALLRRNAGTIDRAFRVLLGLTLLSLIFLGPKTWWGLVGIVPLLTGIIGSCPLYSVLGINTCSLKGRTAPAER